MNNVCWSLYIFLSILHSRFTSISTFFLDAHSFYSTPSTFLLEMEGRNRASRRNGKREMVGNRESKTRSVLELFFLRDDNEVVTVEKLWTLWLFHLFTPAPSSNYLHNKDFHSTSRPGAGAMGIVGGTGLSEFFCTFWWKGICFIVTSPSDCPQQLFAPTEFPPSVTHDIISFSTPPLLN